MIGKKKNVQTCPRRMGEMGPWEMKEGLDQWKRYGDDTIERCTFCGSINPDEFMRLITAGEAEVGPTDKTYKAYVKFIGGDTESGQHLKFYYQHLSLQQKNEFIRLINAKKMRIGYPGYFYVLPYFIQLGQRGTRNGKEN